MGVDVDEPGGDEQALGVDHLDGVDRIGQRLHGDDPSIADCDVGRERRSAGSIDDAPAADHEVEGQFMWGRVSGPVIGRPEMPGSATNTDPPTPSSGSQAAVVMNSRSSSAPPKQQLLTFGVGTATTPSACRRGGSEHAPAPQTASHTRRRRRRP